MLAFLVFASALLLVTLTLPQLRLTVGRHAHMLRYAGQSGADFPNDEIPQDFPFSLTDDLNWARGRHCLFWRAPHAYVIAFDVEIGFGRQTRPLTLVAIQGNATGAIVWSLPPGYELRKDGSWAVLFKRGHSALLSTQEIEHLRQIAFTT